jgi:hypothetical protein
MPRVTLSLSRNNSGPQVGEHGYNDLAEADYGSERFAVLQHQHDLYEWCGYANQELDRVERA